MLAEAVQCRRDDAGRAEEEGARDTAESDVLVRAAASVSMVGALSLSARSPSIIGAPCSTSIAWAMLCSVMSAPSAKPTARMPMPRSR